MPLFGRSGRKAIGMLSLAQLLKKQFSSFCIIEISTETFYECFYKYGKFLCKMKYFAILSHLSYNIQLKI